MQLETQLGEQAQIGVAIYQPQTADLWSYRGDERFPLTSTFKTLACAKVLSDVEQGKLSLTDSMTITPQQVLDYAPVTKNYIGKEFSLNQACEAALTMSDNTAANQILTQIGGPKALTQYLQSIDDEVTRLDRYEPELNQARDGDPRDTTTPKAITLSLSKIILGDSLTPASRAQLIDWMEANKVADPLMRQVLPQGWRIADRSGAGGFGARSMTAIVWPSHSDAFILSVYIKNTNKNMDIRNSVIREISQKTINLIQKTPSEETQ
ncbi:MAG: class A beta-lactamase [Vibrio sp.]